MTVLIWEIRYALDIEKYIASGILEAYALHNLSELEKAEVEAVLVKYPQLREELNRIEEGLENLALETAITPPPELREMIFDKLDSAELPETEQDARVVTMTPATSKFWNYVAAASVLLALFSAFMAYDYRVKWKQAQDAFAQLQSSNRHMANQYDQVNQSLAALQNDIGVMNNAAFNRVAMRAVNDGDTYIASVYWNAETLEAYLAIGNLKALSEEQQYQLWAIVDGKPVDLGVFDFDQEGLLKMTSVANAATFAVTIEPKGGSENPTLEAMQVAGNV